MTPERWQQVKQVLDAALECSIEERADYLNRACGDDDELRREVESLLAAWQENDDTFLERPAVSEAMQAMAAGKLKRSGVAQQINRYEILAPIGAGGMGEVYLARDKRLNRQVALKLLKAEVASDGERLLRFEQEACAASALNHPNIITIYEVDQHEQTPYIAAEYIDGVTLRERIAGKKGIGLPEALDIGLQVASGLAAAHAAGIMHRDIKPENIMLRRDGIVKILDFGLAKLAPMLANEQTVYPNASPKLTHNTEPGMVMGTISYMSPEQAQGQVVDARTDIWSLGVVLYEMFAGRVPFEGPTNSHVVVSVLEKEPASLAHYRQELPQNMQWIVRKCLRKNRDERYQTAKDLAVDLKNLKLELEVNAELERSVAPHLPGNETSVANGNKQAAALRTTEKIKARTDDLHNERPAEWSSVIPHATVETVQIKPNRWRMSLAAAAFLTIASGILYLLWMTQADAAPKVSGYTPITSDGREKGNEAQAGHLLMFSNAVVTDGARIYFSEKLGSRINLRQVSAAGGEAVTIPVPFPNTLVFDLAPNGSELLVGSQISIEYEAQLWALPVLGGSPRRIGDVLAHAAAWSPDGQRIAYATGFDLHVADSNGANSRKLATIDGRPHWLRWSPDGSRLRFTVVNLKTGETALWEITPDGANLRPLLPDWNTPAAECCGNWTKDGKHFLFQSARNQKIDVWMMREQGGLFRQTKSEPVQITSGPMNFRAPVANSDGGKIYTVAEQQRGELVRYDTQKKQWAPYLSGLSALALSFSSDGQWVAYVTYPEGSLWRSRADGSERLQLTRPPLRVHLPRWSPDGKTIAFHASVYGRPWKIHTVSATGGQLQQLMPGERNERDPNWSPNGEQLTFNVGLGGDPVREIYLIDLRTKVESKLPGSEGMASARWSPDGRYISAMSFDGLELSLFDLATQQWTGLAKINVSYSQWSHDSKYIYFTNSREKDPAVIRVHIESKKIERVVELKNMQRVTWNFGQWLGLAPDDSPIALRDLGTEDIYALELQTY